MISRDLSREISKAVPVGVETLKKIKAVLEETQSIPENVQWLQKVDEHLDMAQPRRATIGVFGTTGAGKSFMLNSLIGDTVLPTSSTRLLPFLLIFLV